jgi:hypothetical protein
MCQNNGGFAPQLTFLWIITGDSNENGLELLKRKEGKHLRYHPNQIKWKKATRRNCTAIVGHFKPFASGSD